MTDRPTADAGMVTAEVAVALPALVLVLAIAMAGVGLGIDQVRCAEAVRVGARMLARAQPEAEVRAAVLARVPTGAVVTLGQESGAARVAVTAPGGPGARALGLGMGCSAEAFAPVEAA